MSSARRRIAELRLQAEAERTRLALQVRSLGDRSRSVRGVADLAWRGARWWLRPGGRDLASTAALLGRAGLVPVGFKLAGVLLRSRVGRIVLVGAAVAAGVWWWRHAARGDAAATDADPSG